MSSECKSDVQEFFKDTSILITGVTGFLGQVLLNKLLRSCPVKQIFLVIRRKKEESEAERLQSMLKNEVFQNMDKFCPDYLNKISVISGDCNFHNMGLSIEDQKKLENEVNIVYHVAASVNFNAPIKDAAQMNVRSTSDLIKIASRMENLKAFVYVSTAYASSIGRSVVEEKFYKPPIYHKELLTITEELDEEITHRISPWLLKEFPNTYVYTKSVAEDLCREYGNTLPVMVFRPSIVTSTVKEPMKGWINNMYGPNGVTAAAAVGLLRCMHTDGDCTAHSVPCDYVINALIAATWDFSLSWKEKKATTNLVSTNSESVKFVYNYSGNLMKKPITWREFLEYSEMFEPEIPSAVSVWAYSFRLIKYKITYQICCVFLHLIPAAIVDSYSVITGNRPRLWKAYKKLHALLDSFGYFSTREWKINCENIKSIKLSRVDEELFYFDLNDIDWYEYMRDQVIGIRKYILKEKMDTIPEAKRRRQWLLTMHYILTSFLTLMSFYATFKIVKKIFSYRRH